MKTKLMYSALAGLALVGVIFSGCSGGGGSSATTATTPSTGFFVDSAVQGLTYKGAQSGLTGSDGSYSFIGTDRVEFLLGDSLSLGTLVPKTTQVSVLDFFDNSKTVADQEVINLLVLIQSLDSDGNVSNGITILPATIALLETQLGAPATDLTTIDFTTMTSGVLSAHLTAIITPPMVLVSEADATAHFTQTLYGVQPPVATITGTTLACNTLLNDTETGNIVSDAGDFNASDAVTKNISSSDNNDTARDKGNSHNNFGTLSAVVAATKADGTLVGGGWMYIHSS